MLTQAEPSASGIADLSGVRGGAALIVLFAHVIQVFWLRFSGLDTFLHLSSSAASHYAVVTFFVLSGFLITHSIELNARRYGRLRLDVFFAARIARLYPPLLVAIALSVAIYLLLGYFDLPGRAGQMKLVNDLYSAREIIHVTPREWLSALLMSHGMLEINGPLWSLYMQANTT